MSEQEVKSTLLLDTSPLITLCGFQSQRKSIVEYILPHYDLILVQTVADEATANLAHPDTALIARLLKSREIKTVPVPTSPLANIIDAYTKLGQGERDTFRLALTMPFATLILDDFLAFVVASRFGLKPILLLDFVVSLVERGEISKQIGLEITSAVSARYSRPFVDHTRYKLNEASK